MQVGFLGRTFSGSTCGSQGRRGGLLLGETELTCCCRGLSGPHAEPWDKSERPFQFQSGEEMSFVPFAD